MFKYVRDITLFSIFQFNFCLWEVFPFSSNLPHKSWLMGNVSTDILGVSLPSLGPVKVYSCQSVREHRHCPDISNLYTQVTESLSEWLLPMQQVSAPLRPHVWHGTLSRGWEPCARVLPSPDTWHHYLFWGLPSPQSSMMEQCLSRTQVITTTQPSWNL